MNTVKLGNYLFTWFWRKYERWVLLITLLFGAAVTAVAAIPVNTTTYEHIAIEFRTYDIIIDGSVVPIIFFAGLFCLFLLIFIQINSFYTNGKGMYTILTLPIKRSGVVTAFFLAALTEVLIYFALWLIMTAALYFPVTSACNKAAAEAVIYYSQETTITGLNTEMTNGFFLAFQRSAFLSTVFPGSLLQLLSLASGIFLSVSSIVCAGLHNERVWLRLLLFVMAFAGFLTAFYRIIGYFNNGYYFGNWTMFPNIIYLICAGVFLGLLIYIGAVTKFSKRREI